MSILQESWQHFHELNIFFKRKLQEVQEALKTISRKIKSMNCQEAKRRFLFYTYRHFSVIEHLWIHALDNNGVLVSTQILQHNSLRYRATIYNDLWFWHLWHERLKSQHSEQPFHCTVNNKICTNLPHTLHANSGRGPSWLFKSVITVAGAGDGDLRFLTTWPGPDPFAPGPAGLRFFLFGSVGFIKL